MSKRKTTVLSAPDGRGIGRLVQTGGMLFSSSITGADPAGSKLSDDPAKQVAAAFANLRRLLDQAGASLGDLGLVTICLSDGGHAALVDRAWRDQFPDAGDQPVRKINEYTLPAGELVQLQVVGASGGKRQLIALHGFTDTQPLGVRVGNIVFSAPIDGRDPATGRRSADTETEMRQAFRNLEAFVKQAGGGPADLIHVYIFIRGKSDQEAMLAAWLEAFPTDGDRPARKAIFDETLARGDSKIHLMCVAVPGGGQRLDLEVPGISKRHPNPMGAKIGHYVFSSGIGGDDPAGKIKSREADVCAAMALGNMRTLIEQAGGSLADVGLISITVNDYADEAAILEQWRKVFPDPADEPARHVMAFGGRGSYPVQLHVVAALSRG